MMSCSHSDTTLTIDLDAILSNYLLLKNKVHPLVCAAVVKANAYGLGASQVASVLSSAGCHNFFVAHLDEALSLRKTLTDDQNIYVFNGIREGQHDTFLYYNITPVLNTKNELALWQKEGFKAGKRAPCVVHIDTGMNRLGLDYEYALSDLSDISGLNVKFLMTHMACADVPASHTNQEQLDKFNSLKCRYGSYQYSLANSPSIFLGEDYIFDLVRPGAALYGVNPTPQNDNPMKNVIKLKSKIIQIRSCKKGTFVGYSSSYKVSDDARIATLSIGYADGYLRSLSSNGNVYIENHKVPVVGRVSMDLITVDVTHIPDGLCYEGKEVEIIGDNITVDEVARDAGTIGYQILTSLGARFHKTYLSDRTKD
ncbi:MAG: alanine racemase [Rickettsiales bacterium]|nr:alanine racemase [Rickettsiales bacterium]